MLNKLDMLTSQVENARIMKQDDLALMQALSALYLAKELEQLRSSLERVTEASAHISGGFAIRTTKV